MKLEKRLFNDPRFYMLSEKAQLNYVKFMLFAAETYNRIPKNLSAIRKGFKTNQSNVAIENTISEIRKVFPKFKENGEYYYFEEFESKTNYIRECPSIAEGTPKEVTDIDIDIDKEEDKDKKVKKDKNTDTPAFSEFLSYCKTLSIYHSSLDFQIEAKYNVWVENKWKDGNNKAIKNWKIKIQNTMPYFKRAYTAPEKGTSRVVEDYKKTREMLDKLNTPINEIWKPEVK